MLAFTAAAIFGSVGAPLSGIALAQDQVATDTWVDPGTDPQWTADQQTDTWVDPNASTDGGWVDPNASGDGVWVDPNATASGTWDDSQSPVAVGAWTEPDPSYDANGNLLDPATGQPLAIGADGNPIDAGAGLYYDAAGNLINPAT
ncbi:MAG: hypothetical protein QM692_24265, partial [Thermomicrobiales bacterium]